MALTKWHINAALLWAAITAGAVALYWVLVKAITGGARGAFLNLNDEAIRGYTGSEIDISNLTYQISWIGCGPWTPGDEPYERFEGGCGQSCSYDGSLVKAMQEYNDAQSGSGLGERVSYSSRAAEGVETVQLSGWLLQAAAPGAPRLVVQHGNDDNSNGFVQQLTAYRLRLLGFTVLVNNFRDHGYSANSKQHLNGWGDAYPYDTLGAWDYLVNDPEGKLEGGAVDASRVGLVGFSLGAFTTTNAFGLEGRVPAAWVDAPPFSPYNIFANSGLPFASRIWPSVLAYAADRGIQLERNTPEKNLPMGPDTKRPFFVAGNPADADVLIGNHDLMVDLAAKYPEKYDLQSWKYSGNCYDYAHIMGILIIPEDYVSRLCKFLKDAFGEPASICDTLPMLFS